MFRTFDRGDTRLDTFPCRANFAFVAEVEFHAAHVGLMRDGQRVQLEHHREPDLGRDPRRVVFGRRDFRARHGNSVRGEKLLGLHFREQRSAGGARAFEQLRRTSTIGRCARQLRRLVQRAQILAVLPHVHERARRLIRKREGRNAGRVENLVAAVNTRPAHPACEQRFARHLRDACDLRSSFRRIGHALRRERHQNSVRRWIFRDNFERLAVALGAARRR
jgi:hypothetical protein